MAFDWWDILGRVGLAFVLVLIATRTLGKKMMQSLSYLDFMAAITLGSLTGAIVLDHNITLGDLVLAISAFTVLVLIMSFFQLKSRRIRRLLSGVPIEVVHDGKILEKELERSRLTMENLTQQLRLRGVFDIAEVKQAYLETNGQLSVLLRPEAEQLRTGTFLTRQTKLPDQRHPVELIVDGNVLSHNLERWGYDLAWLMQELDAKGVRDTSDVAYAVLNSKNELYVDLYRDNLMQ
ncbi:YetF domain-containing protein [Tumebacillus flagellatus]|uniref:DUF421 domain-containing protein n=1 Tax=Tumebacillus flagellatus TaxID=1157490 RepID=A0A074LRR9_9BACL|nr:DUF421 domain-containing protein [Tumebacillus flagellatus]KEO84846.1 hypothetical protein EL26_02220 [Tumebacillus flagellatus]